MTDAMLIRAAVYGHLVGDAIGVPYEFTHHIERVELRGHGTHNQPPGTWSDDGALMLALLDSLVSVGFDPEDQARRALAWADGGAYTPDGDGAFDIGHATASALHRLRNGVVAVEAGGPMDSSDQGNGSLMRILPLALIDPPDDDAELVRRAHLASRVTHGAAPCQVACALYVLVARSFAEHADAEKNPEAALALATDRLTGVYEGEPPFASVLRELLGHRGRVRKPGGGWVLDSFWSAWEAVAGSASYRETIERAVRYGNDTDTTAAIAGGLAGLRWGLEGIPGDWRETLRGGDIVEAILGRVSGPASREPLPSKSSAGEIVGGLLGTLDQALTNRPRPPAQIEQRYEEPWATLDGVTVEGLDEPIERREPPRDDSGAKA